MEEKMNENIIEDTANQQENSAEALSNSENINNSETNDNKVSQSEGLKRYEKILDLKENLWTYGSPVLFQTGHAADGQAAAGGIAARRAGDHLSHLQRSVHLHR